MRILGRLAVSCYRAFHRVGNKCFSLLISGAFAGFGRRSVLSLPIRLAGEERIRIGEGVFLGSGCWLQALTGTGDRAVAISIGNGTSIAGGCVISAAHSISLEDNVLVARNVYISDHIHKYSDLDLPILAQGLDKISPVVIRSGAWLGQNVVVCPGVTIGTGAVVGANSVVNQDIPDYSVAVGAPAKVVKRFALVSCARA